MVQIIINVNDIHIFIWLNSKSKILKIKWVISAVKALIKKFKYFSNIALKFPI